MYAMNDQFLNLASTTKTIAISFSIFLQDFETVMDRPPYLIGNFLEKSNHSLYRIQFQLNLCKISSSKSEYNSRKIGQEQSQKSTLTLVTGCHGNQYPPFLSFFESLNGILSSHLVSLTNMRELQNFCCLGG